MPKTKEKAPSGLPSRMELSSGRPLFRKDQSITENPRKQDLCAKNAPNKHTEDTEIPDKFAPHKAKSFDLAESYRRLSFLPEYELTAEEQKRGALNFWMRRAERTESCGQYLEFAHEITDGEVSEKGKLHTAYFCMDRLCPMCAWRRSLKIFGQVSQILELISGDYTFLFLTLTVPNCTGEVLSDTLNRLNKAFYQMTKRKKWQKAVKGYFRALEITYNKRRDDFHPHFHCILAVPKDYLQKKTAHADKSCYIKHEEWLDMWRKAYKEESIQMVNIKAITHRMKYDEGLTEAENLEKAVAEACKYAVKSDDIIHPDIELTDKVVRTFSDALYHRRLSSFSGCFADAFKKLGLDDAEADDADLTHISGKLNPALAWLICRWEWKYGVYVETGQRIEKADEHKKGVKK